MKRSCIRLGCLLTAAVLSAGFLTGCGNQQQVTTHRQQVEISFSWWGNDTRTDYTLEAIAKFETMHPDIKVNCNYSEWSGYEDRNRVQMMSDTESDVMQVNFGWLAQYSPDGKGYYDLEALGDTLDLSSFTADALSYGRRNGVLNAIPIAMNTETVYFNETLYRKYGLSLPQTWDDLFEAAKIMQPDGVYPIAAVAKSMWLYLLAYAEQSSGRTLLNDEGELNFKPEDFQLMIEMYVRLINEGAAPQVEYYERTNIDKGVYAGTVAWVSDAVNYLTTAIENGDHYVAGDYTNFDPAQSGIGWYAKPATLYAVSKNTDHPKEAALLLDYLLNSQQMAVLQGVEKGIPLSSKAQGYLEEAEMMGGIQYEASQKMEQTSGMLQMQPFLENTDLIDAYIDACNQVLYEKAEAPEAGFAVWQKAKSLL